MDSCQPYLLHLLRLKLSRNAIGLRGTCSFTGTLAITQTFTRDINEANHSSVDTEHAHGGTVQNCEARVTVEVAGVATKVV